MKRKVYRKLRYIKYLNRKQRRIMKKLKRKHNKSKRKKYISDVLKVGLTNKVLNLLEIKNFAINNKRVLTKCTIEIPTNFSLLTNPDESMEVLKKIYGAFVNRKINEIFFDYSKCEELEMGASVVTDIIIKNSLIYRKHIKSSIKMTGNYPKSDEAKEIFMISGLLKHLGLSNHERKNVIRLDIISNEEQEKTSEKVIDYYEKCLNTQGYGLSIEGKNAFAIMVGEVLDNAIQHAGTYSCWYAAGHFTLQNEGYGKCRLVLFNFGDSIYESLENKDTTEYTKTKLRNKVKEHINLFNRKWTKEVLWTLYALQYNVSRKRENRESDRGKGTIKLIHNFMSVGENSNGEKPLMSIFSGHSHILFDKTYQLKEELIDGQKVPLIAFNNSNNLSDKPDEKYVKWVKNSFPGTMISMSFYLDRKFINKEMEENRCKK